MVEDAAEGMVEVVIAEVVMGVVATVIAESARMSMYYVHL